jgi:glycosyltransferase involved in cell wall biosynthesis
MDGCYTCTERLAPGLDVTFPSVEIQTGRTLANAWSFRQAIQRIRPDVLATYNWGTIEWALGNFWESVRQVHIEDGFGPEEQFIQIPRRVLMRRAVLRRKTVVLPSQTLLKIATEVWRLSPKHLRYIPNGVDLQRFTPADRPTDPTAALVIGTVAALRAEKNIVRLLHAFAALPNHDGTRLVIVGDGPDRAALEALSAALGLAKRATFAGHVTDPASVYRGFDIFALSSDTEQMPLSLLEAMAAGLPVVTTDVGDIRNMLAEENLPYVTPRKDEAFADALRRLADARPEHTDMGRANRRKAERLYDERSMIDAYRGLFAAAT